MASYSSSLCFLNNIFLLIFLLFGHEFLQLQALHHVYRASHRTSHFVLHQHQQQPYRTSYHFQPPKNWINGTLCQFLFFFFFWVFFFLIEV
uniref:Uncharacterized protein n=1 Tax=Cucumis sativus TaxID=3659 RepID=A0A0A0KAZ1_CUCSA